MGRAAKFGKNGKSRRRERITRLRGATTSGRDVIRRDEHLRIAPKHPGMGRR